MVDGIVTACQRLSKKRIGALIVVQRKDGIAGFASAGTLVNADVSAFLLQTIFYRGTPLHDGAAFIMGGRVMFAGCHLPLSEVASNTGDLGTRHCAAVGLSEQSDALVIVVSEETGRISVAQSGRLDKNVSINDVRTLIYGGIVMQLASAESAAEAEESRTRSQTIEFIPEPTHSSGAAAAASSPRNEAIVSDRLRNPSRRSSPSTSWRSSSRSSSR